uniref:Carboxylic ester hydrolase n=1 Tax=Psilocybe cubensis TaxID=181762 RepID=A0A8H7Y3F6_PSICU
MLILLLNIALIASVAARASVKVGNSTIIGKEFGPAKVEFFGGIPFAETPIGKLRFHRPVLLKSPSSKVLHAHESGKGCLQLTSLPDTVSEDCLSLDVYRPAGTSEHDKLPVMVWIYGGGFFAGSSSLYNGTGIVAHSVHRGTPVIFATFNYRLGPLGFPQGVEAGERKVLNLGLHDQLAALEWIQDNIARFGGDNKKVTVFGQSAGAAAISIHLREKKIRSLARAAILESTPIGPLFGPDRNEDAWRRFVAATPACASVANSGNTIDCMRTADSQAIFQALTVAEGVSSSAYQPVIDGHGGLVVDRPSQVDQSEARLPLLIGTNLDEGTLFTSQKINSTSQIIDFFTTTTSPSLVSPVQLADTIEQILRLYPDNPALGSPFGTGNNTFGLSSQYKRMSAIFGDFTIQSPTRTIMQNTIKAGVKVFGYLFTDPDGVAIPGLANPNAAPGSVGVPHSAEVFYVFGTLANRTPTAISLSKNMRDYWISFATSLDPNDNHGNTSRPHWQHFTSKHQHIIELNGHHTRMISGEFRKRQIEVFQNNPNTFHR